jgi:hypothetical protein
MKTLYQSLIDYEMALLRAIADCRDISLETFDKREALAQLCEALLSPAATAIFLADLSAAEQEALQLLLVHGGQIEALRFSRQFGAIRPIGPARLVRERPWENPLNPAELLWYKGFIYKAFQLTPHGNTEFIYIPIDLRPLILASDRFAGATPGPETGPEVAGPERQAKIFQFPILDKKNEKKPDVSPSQSEPEPVPIELKPTDLSPSQLDMVISSAGRWQESLFSLLVYLQTRAVQLENDKLGPKHLEALTDYLPASLLSELPLSAELDFLIHLGRRTGLLTYNRGRIKPDRETVRTWLQATETERLQRLQHGWRVDPTWNDLAHVPTLVLRSTGWENSPLLARSKILKMVTQAEISTDTWLSLDQIVTTIKQKDPDFQRPTGDYESWYISDQAGNSLMGFDNWDKVEGALIRYILTHILFWLGAVELGVSGESEPPAYFRLTPSGEAFLFNRSLPELSANKPLFIRVLPGFQVQVPQRANLYDRFQLARFAELERREINQVIYRISQTSVGRALRNGVTADQMVAFLARATNNQTPLKVVETLRTWGTRQGTAYLERTTILRLKHESQVEELRQNQAIGPLLGEIIGSTAILIPSENTLAVRRLLTELGYLADPE